MKIPSLVKLPKYKRFNIEPRYYDPIKEDIAERTARIRKELEADKAKAEGKEVELDHHYQIRKAFASKRDRETGGQTSTLQLIIMLLLTAAFVGWLFYGNMALYAVSGISVLLYILFKLRNSNNA